VTRDAVLLMAYGSPDNLDQVEAYYTDIRRGSPPAPHLLEELKNRYRAIGGGSPLSRIVGEQRLTLEAELAARGAPIPVYAAMRHIAPRIWDVVAQMVVDGVERIVAIPMAPQKSSNAAGYRRAVERGLEGVANPPEVVFVESWHDEPRFIEALAVTTRELLARFEDPAAVTLMFTAHSLPARVVAEGDPYPDELACTARLVAREVDRPDYTFSFQSAGRTEEPWLGPDILAEIRRLAAEGVTQLAIRPVGFVADHLEVLYDLDIEAKTLATSVGIRLERARSMNTDPVFIAGLADVALAALGTPVPA
jgi:ferrochelatase